MSKVDWVFVSALAVALVYVAVAVAVALVNVVNEGPAVGKTTNIALLWCFLKIPPLSSLLIQRHKWNVFSVEVLSGLANIIVSNPGGLPRMGGARQGEDRGLVEVGVRVSGAAGGKVTRLSEGQITKRERARKDI